MIWHHPLALGCIVILIPAAIFAAVMAVISAASGKKPAAQPGLTDGNDENGDSE